MPFPGFIEPALATLRTTVPAGARFAHELKLDGYRVQAHLRDGRVTLYTRSGLDWTNRFAAIAADVARLPAEALVVDGEVISADESGRPNFSALQDDLKRGRYDRMVYYAFDLMHLDGYDTRVAPLLERKRVLASLLTEARHQRAPRPLQRAFRGRRGPVRPRGRHGPRGNREQARRRAVPLGPR